MRSRVLVAALLSYLVLDFSNPLIPGAVSFVSGEIGVVEGAPSRGPDTPAAAIATVPGAESVRPVERGESSAVVARPPVCTAVVFAPRQALASTGDLTSSPDDD